MLPLILLRTTRKSIQEGAGREARDLRVSFLVIPVDHKQGEANDYTTNSKVHLQIVSAYCVLLTLRYVANHRKKGMSKNPQVYGKSFGPGSNQRHQDYVTITVLRSSS